MGFGISQEKNEIIMYWANFLHIYQPPTQTREILLKITNESYRKILAGLLENPQAKLTLNINAGLTEMLAENNCLDVIENIKVLLERGQVELTESAKYHPILPKLPESQIIRQIHLNHETNKKYFGDLYKPKGFFPPEMAYDSRIGDIVQKLGYEWIILDELACPTTLDPTKIFTDKNGMKYFFRERDASFKILSAQLGTAQSLFGEFGNRLENNEYLLTAMDGETFGHHRPGLEKLLTEIYKSSQISTVLISDLPKLFPDRLTVEPLPSTWAFTSKEDFKKNPFSRWDEPKNPIHQKQWKLTNLVIKLADEEGPIEQKLVDSTLYSDQYWWASAKPWWSLEEIEKGAFGLLGAVKKFKNVSKDTVEKAENLYIDIITTGFEWQRNGTVAALSREEDEEIKTRMGDDKKSLSREDFEQMIETLEKQMLTAADSHEYLRAESFRKRIEELKDRNEIKVNQ